MNFMDKSAAVREIREQIQMGIRMAVGFSEPAATLSEIIVVGTN